MCPDRSEFAECFWEFEREDRGESESRLLNSGFNDGMHSATTAEPISVLDHTMTRAKYLEVSVLLRTVIGIKEKMRNMDALDSVS
jgi:hypothetical protein